MIIVISPYHLTTRETPAMAGLLLADIAVTLLPAATAGGRDGARKVAETSTAYRELVRSWVWCEELFRLGVLRSHLEGDDAVGDVRGAAALLLEESLYQSLRPLVREHIYATESSYLSALAADILKGGPDPGINVPVAAGLDQFAARRNAFVARSHPASVTQKVEAGLHGDRTSVVLPLLLQADAERLVSARDALFVPLAHLRACLDACAQGGPTGHRAEDLSLAASEYSAAFAKCLPQLTRESEDDDVRLIVGDVVVTCSSLPADAVFRSSLRAIDVVSGRKVTPSGPQSSTQLAPSPIAPISTLTFKVLGSSR